MKTKTVKEKVIQGNHVCFYDGKLYLTREDNLKRAIEQGFDGDGYSSDDYNSCELSDAKAVLALAEQAAAVVAKMEPLKKKLGELRKKIEQEQLFGEDAAFWPDGEEDDNADESGNRISVGCTTLTVKEAKDFLKSLS